MSNMSTMSTMSNMSNMGTMSMINMSNMSTTCGGATTCGSPTCSEVDTLVAQEFEISEFRAGKFKFSII